MARAQVEKPVQRLERNADGDVRLVLSDNQYRVSENVETAHIAWAKPLTCGAVRVLVISPKKCHRETVELAQRLSIDCEVVIMPDAPNVFTFEKSAYWGFDPEDTIRDYREKLAGKHDVIHLANLSV